MDKLKHCNFQLCYPDEMSERHFYTNVAQRGATLSHVCVDKPSRTNKLPRTVNPMVGQRCWSREGMANIMVESGVGFRKRHIIFVDSSKNSNGMNLLRQG